MNGRKREKGGKMAARRRSRGIEENGVSYG